jgi:hypothetical protein
LTLSGSSFIISEPPADTKELKLFVVEMLFLGMAKKGIVEAGRENSVIFPKSPNYREPDIDVEAGSRAHS